LISISYTPFSIHVLLYYLLDDMSGEYVYEPNTAPANYPTFPQDAKMADPPSDPQAGHPPGYPPFPQSGDPLGEIPSDTGDVNIFHQLLAEQDSRFQDYVERANKVQTIHRNRRRRPSTGDKQSL
jgi:hypothetical protein